MKKRLIILVLAPVLGAILGFLLAYALNEGWFSSKWQVIEKPPGKVQQLVAVSQGSLWIQDDTGALYYNENPSSCKTGCWQVGSIIPTLPIIGPDEISVTNSPCAPSPPLSRVSARISECRETMWIDQNVTFALRNDGSIYLWQVDLYREWSVVLMIAGVCLGAIMLFFPALIILLISWLSNRLKSNTQTIHSSGNDLS
jgi:hypothetical protein